MDTNATDTPVRAEVAPMGDSSAVARLSLTRKLRYLSLLAVNLYIIAHITLWYGFDIQPWGKTAMTGVPALIRGNINAAAVMVLLIIGSVFFFGRGFCGWACHMRGVLEFADWAMRRVGLKGYMRLRERNILLNTRYPWLVRMGAFVVLMMPVTVYLLNNPFELTWDMGSPPPWTAMPGADGLLFGAGSPFNMAISFAMLDILFMIVLTLIIVVTATFVFNYFFGQGAFCRILCPYAFMLTIFDRISPFQRRITRVNQCTGCRQCATNCPQGIDVSREIHHFDGKVMSRECIKCFTCVDSCEYGVLKDSADAAVAQVKPRAEYERRPWHNEFGHVQTIEPMGAVADFVSLILALFIGGVMSRLGGFWFFVGVIVGFLAVRLIIRLAAHLTRNLSFVPGSK